MLKYESPTIARRNCKEIRERYFITLPALAKKSKLSLCTIKRFEANNTNYSEADGILPRNEAAILSALRELVLKAQDNSDLSIFDLRKKTYPVLPILRSYCNENSIALLEFCKMCDININTFHRKTDNICLSIVNRICKTCGWEPIDLINGNILSNKKEESDMSYIPTEKSAKALGLAIEKPLKLVTPTVGEEVLPEQHKTNKRFICDKTGYYLEYDLVQHVRKCVTKEAFLEAVKEGF